jgi:hypothetical protein
MVLVLDLTDLHVLHVLNVGYLFLELFDLIEQSSVFQLA